MGGPPPRPRPAPAPSLPSVSDPKVNDEARRRRQAERNAGGFSSTVLTGSQGVPNEKLKKTTLGGA